MSRVPTQWYIEVDKPSKGFFAAIDEVYVVKKTKYQECQLVHSPSHGKVLILDGRVQSTELDEGEYHEYVVQPAMFYHPHPQSALIIGGGEGATAREILKHKTIKRVVMVDIDREAVEFCKKYLGSWHEGAFTDRRLKLVYGDARAYVRKCRETFDIVIVDLCEPIADGPAVYCYTTEFYESIRRRLNPGGLAMIQSDVVSVDWIEFYPHLYKTLKRVYGEACSVAFFLSSINCLWSATLCGDPAMLRPPAFLDLDVDGLARDRKIKMRFYDSIMHRRISALPRYVRAAQQNPAAKILTDRTVNSIARGLSINQ